MHFDSRPLFSKPENNDDFQQTKVNTLETKFDRFIDVHQFDPNDKNTWPREGTLFAILTKDKICVQTRIIVEHNPQSIAQYTNRVWSYYLPALQPYLREL